MESFGHASAAPCRPPPPDARPVVSESHSERAIVQRFHSNDIVNDCKGARVSDARFVASERECNSVAL